MLVKYWLIAEDRRVGPEHQVGQPEREPLCLAPDSRHHGTRHDPSFLGARGSLDLRFPSKDVAFRLLAQFVTAAYTRIFAHPDFRSWLGLLL